MDRADATGMAADALHAPLREQAIKRLQSARICNFTFLNKYIVRELIHTVWFIRDSVRICLGVSQTIIPNMPRLSHRCPLT